MLQCNRSNWLQVASNRGRWSIKAGTKLQLTVDTSNLHMFDRHGQRIDRVTR
jgi:hypothetical protein